jgi:hypothetical protein
MRKMTVTHARMIEILRYHGSNPTDDSMANKGVLVKNTSFFDCFGVKQHYIYRDIMEWLGY